MKKINYENIIALFTILILGASCSKEAATANKVLMLKVDYLTNTFEGGKEFTFSNTASTFSIIKQYKPPGDFGYLKLTYQELNEPLFDGSIIWAGSGQINFPKDLLTTNEFDVVTTTDIVRPKNGFENIFDPIVSTHVYDYEPVWQSIQRLKKVREYLTSNPTATVKIFLYTPSVGLGNPADWDWIVYLKN